MQGERVRQSGGGDGMQTNVHHDYLTSLYPQLLQEVLSGNFQPSFIRKVTSRRSESTLLGFSFYNDKGKWAVRIVKKSIERIKVKSKKIAERSIGSNTKEKLLKMQRLIEGWVNYFLIANAKSILGICTNKTKNGINGKSGRITEPAYLTC